MYKFMQKSSSQTVLWENFVPKSLFVPSKVYIMTILSDISYYTADTVLFLFALYYIYIGRKTNDSSRYYIASLFFTWVLTVSLNIPYYSLYKKIPALSIAAQVSVFISQISTIYLNIHSMTLVCKWTIMFRVVLVIGISLLYLALEIPNALDVYESFDAFWYSWVMGSTGLGQLLVLLVSVLSATTTIQTISLDLLKGLKNSIYYVRGKIFEDISLKVAFILNCVSCIVFLVMLVLSNHSLAFIDDHTEYGIEGVKVLIYAINVIISSIYYYAIPRIYRQLQRRKARKRKEKQPHINMLINHEVSGFGLKSVDNNPGIMDRVKGLFKPAPNLQDLKPVNPPPEMTETKPMSPSNITPIAIDPSLRPKFQPFTVLPTARINLNLKEKGEDQDTILIADETNLEKDQDLDTELIPDN